jgi:hypothetical protein
MAAGRTKEDRTRSRPEQIAEILTDRIRSVYDLPCHFAATHTCPAFAPCDRALICFGA